jgi:hypothetical protein
MLGWRTSANGTKPALMNIRFEGNNGHDAEATWADSASSSAITSSAHGGRERVAPAC